MLFVAPFMAMSQDDCFPARPDKLVLDQADILSPQQEQALESKLENFDRSNSVQVVVLTVTDLCGMDPAQFTYEVGEKWGVGQKEFDNGVVLMVKPTGGQGERHTFIATGYGVEGVLPDATCKLIVEEELIPHFKSDDMYGGIDAGVNVIMQIVAQEYTAQEYGKKAAKRGKRSGWFGLIVFIFIFAIFIISRLSRARSYANTNNVGLWTALWLISSTNRSHGGGWSNFNSGGGSFGGGGFGGFGGGSFGGGGAGGSW